MYRGLFYIKFAFAPIQVKLYGVPYQVLCSRPVPWQHGSNSKNDNLEISDDPKKIIHHDEWTLCTLNSWFKRSEVNTNQVALGSNARFIITWPCSHGCDDEPSPITQNLRIANNTRYHPARSKEPADGKFKDYFPSPAKTYLFCHGPCFLTPIQVLLSTRSQVIWSRF